MEDTDKLIQQALREEEAAKKRAKEQKHAQAKQRKAVKKGKTLEQIEAEEGGPVKESMVGMAQTRRAAKRKAGGGVDDTDIVEDVEGIEEELEQEEEDGIKLEAFNLKEEREKGYFDEAGNYVEKADKDAEEDAADAWLQSDEAKVVSAEVRRKIEHRQRAAEAAAAAEPLSATQIARLQYQAAQVLQPGETVAAGLKRLGGHSRRPAKRSRQRGGGSEEPADMAADAAADPEVKEQFNRLTEAAMKLMDAGENDVYTQTKEYFERAAAVYIDVDVPGGSGGGLLAGGASKAAYEDADEDMFASDEEQKEEKTKGEPAQQSAPAAAAPAEPAPPAAAAQAGAPPPAAAPKPAAGAAADETDYSSWSVKELRRFLTERGVNAEGFVEKADLIGKVREVAAQGPEGEAPAGYTFDPATGYFLNAETGMYWDATTGGFCSGGKWYSWDAHKQQFVEWQQGQ
ncbi:hypothetical protein ABPG75_008590 [Micractinium tetrahymenae]